ncbi:hypothetical protein N7462_005940 [Penicillium macrosclerotiorum]|uniref:uncharacterized protein n=1 Tax=Penicillium macrosclerotiorum TaxID=303699 RepID=UPI002548166D|nr:uncharacterized protein N7462_005940 [Penicillium macrosclerotiorum]KAJ5682775.1 hypothetical protein N7462_005940 [Penicillium macrosclerotiorum]
MADNDSPDGLDAADPPATGSMRLFSSYAPGLVAQDEPYVLAATQTIKCGDQNLQKVTKSAFTVDAPRFALPAEDVHSFYPHEGASEAPRVLPHIVFNDPHLPWERRPTKAKDAPSGRPPWLALLVFSSDELLLTSLPGKTVETTTPTLPKGSATRSLTNSVTALAEADRADGSHLRCPNLGVHESFSADDTASYIVLSKDTFETLLPQQPRQPDTAVPLEHFTYCAHVREVTIGSSTEPFSVIFSHRTAPVHDSGAPQVAYVHLVSLDGIIDNLDERPLASVVEQIALVSLYSWTYRAAPTDPVSYHDILQALNVSKQPLRRPSPVIDRLTTGGDSSATWLAGRLEQGYTIMRHHIMSGETTTTLYRGPLTPQWVSPGRCPPTTSGRGLQQLDALAGIMDISYSVAWELGRSLAIADKAFTAAIMRLRGDISAKAVDGGATKTQQTFATLGSQESGPTPAPTPPVPTDIYAGVQRWTTTALDALAERAAPRSAPAGAAVMLDALQGRVRTWLATMANAMADYELGGSSAAAPTIVSAHWATILRWIKAKRALQGIPYIYLFPDPAVLPIEALRTFYIDENWTDALIDGALSIANHSTLVDDPVKHEIRTSLDVYVQRMQKALPAASPLLAWRPRWGLVLRSSLVHAYPNLRIQQFRRRVTDVMQEQDQTPGVFTALAEDSLIYFQSQTPGALVAPDTVAGIIISQPFHHQRFSVGDQLNTHELKLSFKLFGKPAAAERIERALNVARWTAPGGTARFECQPRPPNKPDAPWFEPIDLPNIYNWQTRCLDMGAFVQACHAVNTAVLTDEFRGEQPEATAAYIGVQFNDELLMLQLSYDQHETAGSGNSPANLPSNDAEATPEATAPEAAKLPQRKLRPSLLPGFSPVQSIDNGRPLPALRTAALGAAVPTVPENAASYNNLLPLTTSQLAKVCSPLLPQPQRHFPAGGPRRSSITLDVLVGITAIQTVRQDIFLAALTVHIPMGQINTNLLLPVTTRPHMTMVGPGRCWTLASRVTTGKRHRVNLDGSWTVADAADEHDQDFLSVTITPMRDKRPLRLVQHPQLSFVLYGMAINPLACERTLLLVEEEYRRDSEEGVFEAAGTVHSVVAVTKEQCEWVG